MKPIKILIVDDHQIIIEGYQRILENLMPEDKLLVYDSANTCDAGWEKISNQTFDLVVLDLNFPTNISAKISSGEQLAHKIKEQFPSIRIIILTGEEETMLLKRIIKTINPEGLLLKGETNGREVFRCIETILDGNLYYSQRIHKLIRINMINTLDLDDLDQRILELLSLGILTKNLPKHLPLSLRAIEVRKRKLRELLDASDDENLINQAKKHGYL